MQSKSWKNRRQRKSTLIRLVAGLVATFYSPDYRRMKVLLFPWNITLTVAFSIENWTTRRPLGANVDACRKDGHFNVVMIADLSRVAARYLSSNPDPEAWESEGDDDIVSDKILELMMDDAEVNDEADDMDIVSPSSSTEVELDVSLRLEWEQWSLALENALSALEKKRNSLQQEMVKAERLESLQRRAQLLQTYRHMFTDTTSATVQDWETGQDVVLTLDTTTYGSIGEEIDVLYAQSKKLKRGKLVVGALLDETSAEFDDLMKMKGDLDGVWFSNSEGDETLRQIDRELFLLVQNRLVASAQYNNFVPPKDINANASATSDKKRSDVSNKSVRQKNPALGAPASNIRKFTSPAGCTILVGRNRRGNEYLSLSVARGNDIWMHARNTPGAHVVLQQRRGGAVATDACWQRAADLAAFYSDARSERNVWVSAAEPKHLQKPRGAPLGAIKVREEWRVWSGHPEDVPEECKEARAVSGQSEEYRMQDKAKLRKQNRQRQLVSKEKAQRKAQKKLKQQPEEQAGNFF
jgi:NFACT N-terminal and middle domains/NFACT protein RNA binding domain